MSTKELFKWDIQKFTTHVGAMDKEHEKLVAIMNKLYDQNENKMPKETLLKTVEELGAWTTTHFQHEESFFDTIKNYAQSEVHKNIHKKLLADFGEHAKKFKSSMDSQLPPAFFQFLKVWLSAHICGIDRKYGVANDTKAA